MRRFELTADDLLERIQILTVDLVSGDKTLSPKAACERATETIHILFDEGAITDALRGAAFKLGGKEKLFLVDLLRKPFTLLAEGE